MIAYKFLHRNETVGAGAGQRAETNETFVSSQLPELRVEQGRLHAVKKIRAERGGRRFG